MTNVERMAKQECLGAKCPRPIIWLFGYLRFFRHSSFVIRHSPLPARSAEQRFRLGQGGVELGWILASAARAFGLSAAFAADQRGDRLDDLSRLHFRGEIRRDAGHE